MKTIVDQTIMSYGSVQDLLRHLGRIGQVAQLKNKESLPEALNQFQPELLILDSQDVSPIVRAYCNNNKARLITLGENEASNISFSKDNNIPRMNYDTLGFKEDVDKTDISVFIDKPEHAQYAEFLCKNYNVKCYGPVKINSPRYLGAINDVEKYEILNKTKVSVVFNTQLAQESVQLGAYPFIFSTNQGFVKAFSNLVSLSDCMDNIDNDYTSMLKDLTQILESSENSLSFTIGTLNTLGLTAQATKLEETYK